VEGEGRPDQEGLDLGGRGLRGRGGVDEEEQGEGERAHGTKGRAAPQPTARPSPHGRRRGYAAALLAAALRQWGNLSLTGCFKAPPLSPPAVPDAPPSDAAEQSARDAGLRYVSDAAPGISRRRRGRGFSYHHPDGSLVSDAERERAESLVIPPAWEDVWVCADPSGHLQATGRDEKGRKQYRYHPEWQRVRNEAKFSRMVPVGEALPDLRERVDRDLRRRGLSREKVLALAVRLLDQTLIRIGNPEYAEDGSYGLTTLRDRHVAFEGESMLFSFVGKSGKEHALTLRDRRLARMVKACRDIPGYTLFQYRTEGGGRDAIDSGDVNAYLRETIGEAVSAKDFRTWGGTVLAAKAFRARGGAATETEAEAHAREVCKEVAAALGNTVAVCRSYYIHPGIPEAYREGELLAALRRRNGGNTPAGLDPTEAAVIGLLRERD
jgi:DNA topoisomerase I